jgi:hypothetical protein
LQSGNPKSQGFRSIDRFANCFTALISKSLTIIEPGSYIPEIVVLHFAVVNIIRFTKKPSFAPVSLATEVVGQFPFLNMGLSSIVLVELMFLKGVAV